MTTTLPQRIRSIDELITWLPYQLGHQPTQSLVLVALTRGRLLGVCRIPLTNELAGEELGVDEVLDVVSGALKTLAREGSDQVHAVAYEEFPGQSGLAVGALEAAAQFMDVELAGLAVVHAGCRRLPWSTDPADRRGSPVQPVETCPAALHLLVDGQAPMPDRAALRTLVHEDSTLSEPVRPALARLVTRRSRRPARAGRLWQRLLADGGSPAQVAALSGDDRAKLLASLADVHWRDAIIAWVAPGSLPLAALPATARAGLRTWLPDPVSDETAALGKLMTLARSAPSDQPVCAHVCAVVGCIAWHLGNGATGRDAHERALIIDPAHRLARLGLRAIDLGMRPGDRPHPGSAAAVRPRPAV